MVRCLSRKGAQLQMLRVAGKTTSRAHVRHTLGWWDPVQMEKEFERMGGGQGLVHFLKSYRERPRMVPVCDYSGA